MTETTANKPALPRAEPPGAVRISPARLVRIMPPDETARYVIS
jgi:hypothetical protein